MAKLHQIFTAKKQRLEVFCWEKWTEFKKSFLSLTLFLPTTDAIERACHFINCFRPVSEGGGICQSLPAKTSSNWCQCYIASYFRFTDIFYYFILKRSKDLFSVLQKYGENVRNTENGTLEVHKIKYGIQRKYPVLQKYGALFD